MVKSGEGKGWEWVGGLHEVSTGELRSGSLQFSPCDLPEAVRRIVCCTRVCTCRHR